jgi:hypothetical protein
MIIRPNAILINAKGSDGKHWNIVYIRLENGKYVSCINEYTKTTDFANLDPFVNFMDWFPDKVFVHPVYGKSDGKSGWYLRAYDTYQELTKDGHSYTFDDLYKNGLLEKVFDLLLLKYNNYTDDELLEHLNFGRSDKITEKEINELYESNNGNG